MIYRSRDPRTRQEKTEYIDLTSMRPKDLGEELELKEALERMLSVEDAETEELEALAAFSRSYVTGCLLRQGLSDPQDLLGFGVSERDFGSLDTCALTLGLNLPKEYVEEHVDDGGLSVDSLHGHAKYETIAYQGDPDAPLIVSSLKDRQRDKLAYFTNVQGAPNEEVILKQIKDARCRTACSLTDLVGPRSTAIVAFAQDYVPRLTEDGPVTSVTLTGIHDFERTQAWLQAGDTALPVEKNGRILLVGPEEINELLKADESYRVRMAEKFPILVDDDTKMSPSFALVEIERQVENGRMTPADRLPAGDIGKTYELLSDGPNSLAALAASATNPVYWQRPPVTIRDGRSNEQYTCTTYTNEKKDPVAFVVRNQGGETIGDVNGLPHVTAAMVPRQEGGIGIPRDPAEDGKMAEALSEGRADEVFEILKEEVGTWETLSNVIANNPGLDGSKLFDACRYPNNDYLFNNTGCIWVPMAPGQDGRLAQSDLALSFVDGDGQVLASVWRDNPGGPAYAIPPHSDKPIELSPDCQVPVARDCVESMVDAVTHGADVDTVTQQALQVFSGSREFDPQEFNDGKLGLTDALDMADAERGAPLAAHGVSEGYGSL